MAFFGATLMGIGNFGWTEGLLIAFLLLILFGAKRLPEIGQSLGKGIREFKKSLTSSDDEPQIRSSDDRDVSQVQSPKQEEVR